MVRKIDLTIDDILDLVNCAEIYGFADSVFMDAMASFCEYQVTDAEIEIYSARYKTDLFLSQGYSQEDYDCSITTLTEWRDRYAKAD